MSNWWFPRLLKYYDSPTAIRTDSIFSLPCTSLLCHATIQSLLLSHNLRQYRPRLIVHPFGFFFLRDGNGDCDNDHDCDDDDDDNVDVDVDVDETEPNVEKDRREWEEGKGDSAEAVILKHRPIEYLRLIDDSQ